MKLNNKSGFTLLEIIIVVIIVGVLASLALPRLFSTVEFSKSSEAMASFSSIRGALDRCHLRTGDYANCTDWTADLDIAQPGTSPGAHFTYTLTSASADEYEITADRTSFDGGTTSDWISLVVTSGASGSVTIDGTGSFQNVQ